MKATHNIKINGCWYSAGEELPEEKKAEAVKQPEPEKEPKADQEERPAEETKPKAASRRKKISE